MSVLSAITTSQKAPSPMSGGRHSFVRAEIRQATRGMEDTRMPEQARKIRHQAILVWAQGFYYNSGIYFEVLVYLTAQSAPKVVAGSVVSWTSLRPLTVIL